VGAALACAAAVGAVLAGAAPVGCAAPVGAVLACAAPVGAVGAVLACAVPVSGAPFSPVPLSAVTTATAAHKAAAALADRRAGITGRPALRIPAPRSVTLSS
jgi:hypothetical protein